MSTTFDSQHCYLKGKRLAMEEYTQLDHTVCDTPVDVDGNALIWCGGGTYIKPYFRRNHCHYEPMTEWHSDWQSHFSESTERSFHVSDHEGQHRTRRADVDLNDEKVIEFQHSPITYDEVSARRKDYRAIGKDIIWVIDGQSGVDVFSLHNDKRVFLEFNHPWKYKSFCDYDYVYVNIGELVYRLFPTQVRSHMLDVEAPIPKADFIKSLKTGQSMFQMPPITPVQSRLIVKQQGAGNGKTFGIVQLIRKPDFAHYDTLVYLTKQHSAVHVIRSEMEDQRDKGLLPNIEFGELLTHGKKTVLPFRVKLEKPDTDTTTTEWRSIIVGTFDSFVYSLARHDTEGIDKFQEMVNTIVNDERLSSCSESGSLKYAGGVRLNKRMLLIGDEMQDLTENYAKAVVRIMRDWYVDFYAVGDRLQSISIKNNAFTYFADKANGASDQCITDGLPNIDVQCPEPHNICRRFIHPKLVDFVNTVVDFDKLALPRIEPYCPADETVKNGAALHFIKGKTVYADSTDNGFINHEVDEIMTHYTHEVETNGRQPKDFLIVTPFVHKNPLVEALHQRIRSYWFDRDTTNNQYKRYSCFHKSEEGTSIDLSESEDCTRIVSIHSSKGDGRKVVFVIGITESALKTYSNDTGNLVYNSLLHVALTRMKEILYVRLEPNGDDIHLRIQSYMEDAEYEFDIEPTFCVKGSLILTKDLLRINQDKIFATCDDMIIRHSEQHGVNIDEYDAPDTARSQKRIIDMKHHMVRYATMIVQSFLTIMRLKYKWKHQGMTTLKLQQYVMLKGVADTDVTLCENGRRYWILLTDKQDDSNKNYIPIRQRKGGEYEQHYNRIYESIQKVQKYLKLVLASHDDSSSLHPLTHMDCLVLFHLIEVQQHRQYAALPISDLYDLFDNEHKASKDEKCLYIKNHYRDLKQINALWEQFFNTNGPMNILYGQPITLHSESTTDLSVYQETTFLAYTSKTVIHVQIKPQFTSLNFNETLFHSIFLTYMLQNIQHTDKNHQRFGNADTHRHCVLTLSHTAPYYIDWKDSTGNNLVARQSSTLSDILRGLMKEHYIRHSDIVRRWYDYTRRDMPSVIRKAVPATKFVLERYDKKNTDSKKQDARFVRGTLDAIKTRVSDTSKTQRWNHLLSYDNKDTFLELLKERAYEAVNDYFGVDSESDEDGEAT